MYLFDKLVPIVLSVLLSILQSVTTSGEIQIESEPAIVTALRSLEQAIETDELLAAKCHGKAHDLGYDAYQEHGLDALKFSSDVCGSGFYHGVIEEHFQQTEDILEAFKNLCKPTDGRCFHGIGHGLMFTLENDLPKAIEYCDSLETPAQRLQCGEGACMQNFFTDRQVHPTKYISEDDWMYPCDEQVAPYRAPCIFYSTRRVVQDYAFAAAKEFCTKLSPSDIAACHRGMGSGAAKVFITRLDNAKALCDELTSYARTDCYDGMSGYVLVHYASTKKASEFCATLMPKEAKRCDDIVQNSKEFYKD